MTSLEAQSLERPGDVLAQLLAEPDEIDKLLAFGAEQAYAIAGPVLEDVKKIIGLTPP